jgi:uncharacterized protein YneF (UPF0154 family)
LIRHPERGFFIRAERVRSGTLGAGYQNSAPDRSRLGCNRALNDVQLSVLSVTYFNYGSLMDIKKILESLVPFLVAGIAIALCVGLLIMFFTVAIWGIVLGGILWCAMLVKQYLFPTPPVNQEEGRIIEHDKDK